MAAKLGLLDVLNLHHASVRGAQVSGVGRALPHQTTLSAQLFDGLFVKRSDLHLLDLFVGYFVGSEVLVLIVSLDGLTTLLSSFRLNALDAFRLFRMVVVRMRDTCDIVL